MLLRNQVDNEAFGYDRTIISRLSWSSQSICSITELQWWFGAHGCLCVCVCTLKENESPVIEASKCQKLLACVWT